MLFQLRVVLFDGKMAMIMDLTRQLGQICQTLRSSIPGTNQQESYIRITLYNTLELPAIAIYLQKLSCEGWVDCQSLGKVRPISP
jgi:hypothetical protein